MKWRAISNNAHFYVQWIGTYMLHEDRRGRPIKYRSIDGAKKAADKLNQQWHRFIREARTIGRALDHLNGDITDNRIENLRVVTLKANR